MLMGLHFVFSPWPLGNSVKKKSRLAKKKETLYETNR